jgi:hypothetical protein
MFGGGEHGGWEDNSDVNGWRDLDEHVAGGILFLCDVVRGTKDIRGRGINESIED